MEPEFEENDVTDNNVYCQICFEKYNTNNRFFTIPNYNDSCNHPCCLICFNKIKDSCDYEYKCPFCRKTYGDKKEKIKYIEYTIINYTERYSFDNNIFNRSSNNYNIILNELINSNDRDGVVRYIENLLLNITNEE